MQTQRTILWVIFATSLFFLWDAWMRHTGQPGVFAPPASTSPVPGARATARRPRRRADASGAQRRAVGRRRGRRLGRGAGRRGRAGAAAGQVLRLANDVLALQIDAMGGEVRRAELLRHPRRGRPQDQRRALSARPVHTYVAQSGLIGAPEGQGFPTHRTAFAASADRRAAGRRRRHGLAVDERRVGRAAR
jgi:YidC/Oxa1 family membrane protein insertase